MCFILTKFLEEDILKPLMSNKLHPWKLEIVRSYISPSKKLEIVCSYMSPLNKKSEIVSSNMSPSN